MKEKTKNRKQQKQRSERSSSYSTDHEHTKNRKVTCLGGAQTIYYLSLNTGKLEFTGTFSLKKLVNHLLVRGTISFYNQKLQILPVGGSAMWNVSM